MKLDALLGSLRIWGLRLLVSCILSNGSFVLGCCCWASSLTVRFNKSFKLNIVFSSFIKFTTMLRVSALYC